MNDDTKAAVAHLRAMTHRLSIEHEITLDQALVVALAANVVLLTSDEIKEPEPTPDGVKKFVAEMLVAKAAAHGLEKLCYIVLVDICKHSPVKAKAVLVDAVALMKELP